MLLAAAVPAHAADSFSSRVKAANALFRSGDIAGALKTYRDLQVEEPESDLLYYGIGCAQYADGEKVAGLQSSDEALTAFTDAAKSFEKARLSSSPEIRKDAEYNLANCMAQIAKCTTGPGKDQETVKAFEDSIAKYEDFLSRYPDDQAAHNNLDHMRYYLKKLLQKPHTPSDQKTDQGQREQDKQQDQDQKQQDQQQQDQQQAQDQQNQDQQKEQDQSAEKKEQEGEKEQKQQEQQKQASENEANPDEQNPQQEANQQGEPPKDRQTIEAILQSLEDNDQREQDDVREGQMDSRPKKEWW